jgi:hypothetical protein
VPDASEFLYFLFNIIIQRWAFSLQKPFHLGLEIFPGLLEAGKQGMFFHP